MASSSSSSRQELKFSFYGGFTFPLQGNDVAATHIDGLNHVPGQVEEPHTQGNSTGLHDYTVFPRNRKELSPLHHWQTHTLPMVKPRICKKIHNKTCKTSLILKSIPTTQQGKQYYTITYHYYQYPNYSPSTYKQQQLQWTETDTYIRTLDQTLLVTTLARRQLITTTKSLTDRLSIDLHL